MATQTHLDSHVRHARTHDRESDHGVRSRGGLRLHIGRQLLQEPAVACVGRRLGKTPAVLSEVGRRRLGGNRFGRPSELAAGSHVEDLIASSEGSAFEAPAGRPGVGGRRPCSGLPRGVALPRPLRSRAAERGAAPCACRRAGGSPEAGGESTGGGRAAVL